MISDELRYRLRRWDLEVGACNLAAPSDEGKRSDTTVVNDTPGECQSRGAESPQ